MAIDKTQAQSQGTQSSSTATKPSSNRGTQEPQNAAAGSSAATTTRSGMRPEVERNIRTETGETQPSRGRGLARTGGAGSQSLMGGNPFRLMQRMAQDMDQLFEQFGMGRAGFSLSPAALFNDAWGSPGTMGMQQTLWSPDVELFKRDDKLVVRADLPGVKKEDLQIDVQNDVLTLSGQRQEQHEESREGWYHSERSYGSFCRAIPLPEGTNAENADATFKDGVLEVTLNAPKQDARNTRRIAIR